MKYASESIGFLWVFLFSVLIVYDKTKLNTTMIMTSIATTNAALGRKNGI